MFTLKNRRLFVTQNMIGNHFKEVIQRLTFLDGKTINIQCLEQRALPQETIRWQSQQNCE